MNVNEMIKKAVLKSSVHEIIQIEIDGQTVEFVLDELDAYEIQEAAELKMQQGLAKAAENGLVGVPLTDQEWEDYLSRETDQVRERLRAEGKPKDRAHFFARRMATARLLLDVITSKLKLPSGELVCNNEEDRRYFQRWISTNGEAMNKLGAAYVELSRKVKEVRDEAKKLSSRTSGESATASPDVIQDIADHSTKS